MAETEEALPPLVVPKPIISERVKARIEEYHASGYYAALALDRPDPLSTSGRIEAGEMVAWTDYLRNRGVMTPLLYFPYDLACQKFYAEENKKRVRNLLAAMLGTAEKHDEEIPFFLARRAVFQSKFLGDGVLWAHAVRATEKAAHDAEKMNEICELAWTALLNPKVPEPVRDAARRYCVEHVCAIMPR